jgi:hypothetical protein
MGQMLDARPRHYQPSRMRQLKEVRGFLRLVRKMSLEKSTRGPFWRTLLRALVSNPRSIRYTVSLMALYLHFGPFSRFVSERIRQAIEQEQQRPSRVASAA